MAAIVAITLYMELPRVAMQAQRDKEQRLIDTGEQYKRAIQLFYAKAKRYPADIKELESFQNQRFLRRRYKDPMTGKEEWRLIHVQNGILTDSKISKPAGPGGDKQPSGPNGFVGEQAGLGVQNLNQGAGAPNQRDRRRASDSANGTMPGTALPGSDQTGGQNNGVPPLPGQVPDNSQNQNQLAGTQPNSNGQPMPGLPGQQTFPGQQSFPGQQTFPVPPGTPMPGQQQGVPLMQGQQEIPRRLRITRVTPSSAEAVPSWAGVARMWVVAP
jgi:type II secretory pathway pseudopilin PulG